uniref:C2H2-type domain-containing protein n=1 Tax=Nothobranchius kuhntae TaxID=321403 RepID=A0A1A8IJ85_NOTKU
MDTDVLQMVTEEAPEDQSAGVDQQHPEQFHIKEEQEGSWTSVEEEHLHVKEETDVTRFTFTVVPIKSEDNEEKPLFSLLHHQQMEDRDVPTNSLVDQMTAGTVRGAETSKNPDLNNEENSISSETEVSRSEEKDDDLNLDSGPETEDGDNDWKESKTSVSGENTVNTSFSCSECGKQYHFIADHKEMRSSSCLVNKTDFSCDCGQRVYPKSNLNLQIGIHSEEKAFDCDVCGQRFRQKSHLDRHVRIHTGYKPFECDVCGQRFRCNSTLKSHMKIHSGQKPFKCDVCQKKVQT